MLPAAGMNAHFYDFYEREKFIRSTAGPRKASVGSLNGSLRLR